MTMISIIVPCYNQIQFLPRCLDSLLRQTFKDIEILCVNDASTDATLDIINEYKKKDKRIKLVDVQHGGLGWARNCGIQQASGKYLMFCDSDDEFLPVTCERLFYTIEDNNCDVAMCSAKIVYECDSHMKSSDDIYYNLKFTGSSENNRDIINKVDVSVWNKIFRKSLIDKYNIKFIEGRLYEDASFTWKYFSVAKKFYCIQDQLYVYYRHKGTIMNKTFAKASRSIDHVYVADNVYEFLLKNDLFEELMDEYFTFYKVNLDLAKKYSDSGSREKIAILENQLREKYLPWIKGIEMKKKIKAREKILAGLRQNVKSSV